MTNTNLINPRALQWTLTNACKSGNEIPVFNPSNGEDANGDAGYEATIGAGDDSLPKAPGIVGALLMTKEGHLVCTSVELGGRAATLTAGLISSVWKQQHEAALACSPDPKLINNQGSPEEEAKIGYILMRWAENRIRLPMPGIPLNTCVFCGGI